MNLIHCSNGCWQGVRVTKTWVCLFLEGVMTTKVYRNISQYKNQLVLRAFHNRFNGVRSRKLSLLKRKEIFSSQKQMHRLNQKTRYAFNYVAC